VRIIQKSKRLGHRGYLQEKRESWLTIKWCCISHVTTTSYRSRYRAESSLQYFNLHFGPAHTGKTRTYICILIYSNCKEDHHRWFTHVQVDSKTVEQKRNKHYLRHAKQKVDLCRITPVITWRNRIDWMQFVLFFLAKQIKIIWCFNQASHDIGLSTQGNIKRQWNASNADKRGNDGGSVFVRKLRIIWESASHTLKFQRNFREIWE
jgi:hypothetical protein